MKTVCLTVILGFAVLGGWAYAQQEELDNHHLDALRLQVMDDGSCSNSSDCGCGQ